MFNKKKKYKALKDYYLQKRKHPIIKKGQKWIVDGIIFLEEKDFQSTWICKRLENEVFLHKREVVEIFGIEALQNVGLRVNFIENTER